MLVQGDVLGLSKEETVRLFLQMTVSGAFGLPRQPKHVMKQYVRKMEHLANVLKPLHQGISTFSVPWECFVPFLFQHETLKEDDDDDEQETANQPDYQLVFEIADNLNLGINTDVFDQLSPASGGALKRVHAL